MCLVRSPVDKFAAVPAAGMGPNPAHVLFPTCPALQPFSISPYPAGRPGVCAVHRSTTNHPQFDLDLEFDLI
jgi:hypothetical protein